MPLDSPFDRDGSANDATPQQSNDPTDDESADEQAGADADADAGAGAGGAASCLVGTWEEDMEVYTDRVKKSTGTFDDGTVPTNITWTSGAFLRFGQHDRFSVWTEDLSISFVAGGTKTRMILDANGGGGYADRGDVIQWSNGAKVKGYLKIFENGKLVQKGADNGFGDFSTPSPYTCTKDTLEVNLDGDAATPLRVFLRVADRQPQN